MMNSNRAIVIQLPVSVTIRKSTVDFIQQCSCLRESVFPFCVICSINWTIVQPEDSRFDSSEGYLFICVALNVLDQC
jgi:hypothetical protein